MCAFTAFASIVSGRTLAALGRVAIGATTVEISPGHSIKNLLTLTSSQPEDTRRVVTLRKVYGFTAAEIAARLTLSPSEVERHLVVAALAFAGAFDFSEFEKSNAHDVQTAPACRDVRNCPHVRS